jgi:hypothetical protein
MAVPLGGSGAFWQTIGMICWRRLARHPFDIVL